MVTKQEMIQVITTREPEFVQRYVGKALVALFHRQLADEKQANTTQHKNMQGFSNSDARTGSIGAKYFLKHDRLDEWQVQQWTKNFRGSPRISKYWKQLDQVAKAKKAQKAENEVRQAED